MTQRERMLAAMRGQPTDEIPFAPRMNLWRIAQEARGTTPRRLAGLNTIELAEALGVGCHSVGTISTIEERLPEDYALRSFGVENHPDNPYRIEIRGLPVSYRQEGNGYRLVVKTPAGDVTTVQEYGPELRREGISVPFMTKFPITSVDDFEPVAQVFEHLEVIPAPGAYAAFRRRMGERGVAVANGLMGAGPMHHLLHDLMAQEEFFYFFSDEREALRALARRMEPFFHRLLDVVAACEAEAVLWGGNYDQNITWPAFFEEEIAPWLRIISERLHGADMLLINHTDGENHELLRLFPACGIDIGESVCPRPMTRCSLKEVRAGMGPKMGVWGGLCSIAFLKDSMSDAAFEGYLDRIFGELGTGERYLVGVSDMVPVDADLGRIDRIKERIQAFGPVRPADTGPEIQSLR